jgi:hypothetical protein
MDKNAIQKYAVWARNELIDQVQQRAYQYGITREGWGDENAQIIAGRALAPGEKQQRRGFISQIKKLGFQQAVEEAAYTWFNRFIALRFMEVNDYLPSRVRVFSDSGGAFSPEILKDVLHLELDGLDRAKVSELLNANKTEELYRYLLLTQCNALNSALPEMFEKLGGYAEMLLPNNILKPDGALGRLVTDIPEDDWKDAVQIIGWMYQYYNTEPKQAVFDGLKKNKKITKEKIPAATQLFTPDWIVRYMVENSLGRLWLESHPDDRLKANWKYYLDEAEQTPGVAAQLRDLRSRSPVKSPEDIRFIDPCMGSGHILVYAFDVLMQIYESVGASPRDAAKLILQKNLYGLDIDRRACQLAYFALMMKARQYNRRILAEGIKPQVCHPAGFPDGEEYGSLLKMDELEPKPEPSAKQQGELFGEDYETRLKAWNFKRLLAQKYDVVVTNPPYMGNNGFNIKLNNFVSNEYSDGKNDLYSAMTLAALNLCREDGYLSMITMQSWINAPTFFSFRKMLIEKFRLVMLNNLGSRAFEEISGEKVKNAAFIFSKNNIKNWIPMFIDLTNYPGQDAKEKEYLSKKHRYTQVSQQSFLEHPLCLLIYKTSSERLEEWAKSLLRDKCEVKRCIATGNDDEFIRHWYEVRDESISNQNVKEEKKWFFIANGGLFRRWYGNLSSVIDWEHNGERLRSFNEVTGKSTLRNVDYMFQEGATYTYTSMGSGVFNTRYLPQGVASIGVGPVIVNCDDNHYTIGFTNAKIFKWLIDVMFGKVSTFETGNIGYIPYIAREAIVVDKIVECNISLSRADWDSFETSWDFARHPMVCGEPTVAAAFARWEREAEERFIALKANEEELNRIFIDIYGLQDELTPEVDDRDVTVYRFFKSKYHIPDSMKGSRYALTLQDAVKSLVSYAVGCIFGRYSLDTEGLAYAGGDWDAGKYCTLPPLKDNILPICDDDYFDGDALGKFVDFIRAAYGGEALEENLKFIADGLGGRGSPREVIRNYFLGDFFRDHCKIYQKRPIYWLFDSGRKHGFKALVYLHRYSRDLLAKLRTDYVHEQQERYRTQLSHIDASLNAASGPARAKLLKQQEKLTEQLKEITAFEEKVHHLADRHIAIDLDDGVKHNYAIFADVLAKI